MDPNLLMRYKFLEILARIAKGKYCEFGKADTVAEAVEKLIKEVILENYQWEPWQEYRDSVVYTLEVGDVLNTNRDGIEAIMKHYHHPRKKYFGK
jgi:hypothetical protein